jgi:hypothetical protein
MTYLKRESGHIPARPSQALYYLLFDHKSGYGKDDWGGPGRLFRGHGRWRAARDYHIDMCPHQVGCKFGQPV